MERISDIKKSRNDKCQYRYIELENGLRCMLVSDNEVERSSASLDVKAGAMCDPKGYHGLAHFCEHMLFLGTQKFPDEACYSTFIKNHGGSNNAFTDLMDTNYYFTVANSALNETLDMFSQFFKEPLFNKDSVAREMNAVDSEHKKNLSSDSWRMNQLIFALANPESHLNQFPTGSIETLSKENIREVLMDFHAKYYSANLMTLCIAGKHSLDDLEKMCREHFSTVKNKNAQRLNTSLPVAYGKDQLGKFLRVVPVSPKHKVIVMWKFPDTIKNYKTKPSHYLSHILGHEGQNSLLSYLIDEELALSLTSYVDRKEANTEFLTAIIELTEKGLGEYERVIEIVGAFAQMLRASGPQKYLFDELSQVERLNFEFRTQHGSVDTAVSLARSLHEFPREIVRDVLEGTSVVTEYDEKAIRELIDLMVPENMIVSLASSSCKELAKTEEKWYKSMYSYEAFSDQLKNRLHYPQINPSKNGKILGLPPVNILVPKNVELLPKLSDAPVVPRMVKETEASTIWYKRDHKFEVPKGYGFCSIQTNDNGYPILGEAHVFMQLYLKIFFEDIREFMYMAEMAGIDCKIASMFDKLTLTFYGFNESLPALVDSFLKKLKEFQPEKSRDLFEIKLAEMKNNVITFLKKTLYALALDNYTAGLSSYGCDRYQYLRLVEEYNFDKFVFMARNWLKNARLEWYIAGNLLEEKAVEVALMGEKLLIDKPLPEDAIKNYKTIAIPLHTEYWIVDKTLNEEEQSSCLISYFQGRPFFDWELADWARNAVAVDFIKESAFDYLRTKLQLGYVTNVSAANLNRVLGARFVVQSNVACPEKVYQRINEFLEEAWKTVKDMSEEQFKLHVNAVCVPLRQEFMNLQEESVNYWKEISKNEYMFDRKKEMVKALESLKREEVVGYFRDLFFANVKRYDYELTCPKHWEENSALVPANAEDARKRGNARVKLASFEEMRELNATYPCITLLNKRKKKLVAEELEDVSSCAGTKDPKQSAK